MVVSVHLEKEATPSEPRLTNQEVKGSRGDWGVSGSLLLQLSSRMADDWSTQREGRRRSETEIIESKMITT